MFKTSADSQGPVHAAMVRCSASERSQKAHGRLFQIECPERLPTLEYPVAPGSPWMTAPIQSSGPEGAAFVEIL